MDILILGIGNVLLRDEGAGVRAIEELESRYLFPEGVELLDGGTSGIELFDHIRNRELLLIIDVVRNGHPPGAVYRIAGEDVPARFMTSITPHQLGISNLLATAQLTDCLPARLVLFGIEPEDMGTGLGLSASVTAGLEKIIRAVVEELQQEGCSFERRPVDTDREPCFWSNEMISEKMEEKEANP